MTRLLQLKHPSEGRRVAVVEEGRLRLLRGLDSIYRLGQAALAEGRSLEQAVSARLGLEMVEYEAVHRGQSEWRLLPAFDHPDEPARCLVTGTGLTHRKSAASGLLRHCIQPLRPNAAIAVSRGCKIDEPTVRRELRRRVPGGPISQRDPFPGRRWRNIVKRRNKCVSQIE